ncbi:MAG: methyltransferase regulatory domain-containing protein [Bdellovibrionota bacterium]
MAELSSYDSVPYLSQPFSFTHPRRLHTLGVLFGLEPAAPESCRILELGCAAAVNLCGIAATLPGAELIGVDLSATELAEGRELVEQLGLMNVSLKQLDIAELGGDLGTFDYIICHGLFSWIDSGLQTKVLSLCRSQLRPNGIAYISYNTLPGWYQRQMIRDMLLYHAEQFDEPEMFVAQARAMAELFSRALKNNNAPLSEYFKNSLKQIESQPDWYLRHDILEEINEPMYFHRFASLATSAGLQYLADSELTKMVDYSFPDDVRQALRGIADDVIRFEQYLDFLWNRSFRRSLVCHREPVLSRERAPERMSRCFLRSNLQRVGSGEGEGVVRFANESGGFLETNDPFALFALDRMRSVFPKSVLFDELFDEALKELSTSLGLSPQAAVVEKTHLGRTIWNLATRGLVEVQTSEWPFVAAVTERPQAYSLARTQALTGLDVTTARHEVIELDERSAKLLSLLDGKTSVPEVAARLGELGSVSETKTAEWVRETLQRFAGEALLVG